MIKKILIPLNLISFLIFAGILLSSSLTFALNADGALCTTGGNCASNYCYPGPENKNYCLNAAKNCAQPGTAGVMYGASYLYNAREYKCVAGVGLQAGPPVVSSSISVCHLDLDPDRLTPTNCPNLDPNIPSASLSVLRESLSKIYRSNEVQTSKDHCAKMADLIQAVCKRSIPITSFFNPKGGAASGKSISVVRNSTDARLSEKPTSVTQFDSISSAIDTKCSQEGRFSITLKPFGAINRCDKSPGIQYPGASNCSTVNGIYTCYNASGGIINPVPYSSYNVNSYVFTKIPANDPVANQGWTYDRLYATMPQTLTSKTAPAAPFCASGSSLCTNFNIPLLYQNSTDLMQLLAKRTRIARPLDVGFCAPTAMAMMMIGLKNLSGGVFGDNIDSGSTSTSQLDGYTAKNWAGAIFQTGKEIGTDWWVGGSPTDQIRSLATSAFGDAAGSVDSFLGSSGDYSNANLINFTNQYGGLVNINVAQDTTADNPAYHSLLLAGHSGGHLRVLDPWGRVYLVDSKLQARNAKFVQINQKIFNYAKGKSFVFPYYNNTVITWEFGTLPYAGQVFPIWFFNLPNQQTLGNYLQSIGVITIITRSGTAVPTLSQISGDAGFVYYSPSQQSQFLTGTETAVRNPGAGTYFQAAKTQNMIDVLYGVGQRVRGVTWANTRSLPTDSIFNAGVQAAKTTGWLGSIGQDANFVAAEKTIKPVWITYSAAPCCLVTNDTSLSGFALQTAKAYSFKPAIWQGGIPTSYSISPALPAGLTINSSTGIISGTATVSTGPTKINYMITASNSGGSVTFKLPISVVGDALAPSLAVFDTGTPNSFYLGDSVSKLIKITGGIPTRYTVTPALPVGLTVDLTKQVVGGFNYIKLTGRANSIQALTNHIFTFTNDYGSTTVTNPLTIVSASTTAIAPIAFSYSPSSGVNLLIGSGYGFGRAVVDTTATRAPTIYTISPALPVGFTFDTTTGNISANPIEAVDLKTYVVTASNAKGSVSTNIQFSVKALAAPAAFTYSCSPSATNQTLGATLSCRVPISTTSYRATSFSISPPLPAGFTLYSDGSIFGNSTSPLALKTYVVTASNATGSVNVNLPMSVSVPGAPSSLSYSYPNSNGTYVAGAVGHYTGISYTLSRSYGGGMPTSYTSSPILPSGFVLDPVNGNITVNTSTVLPLKTYVITASNSSGSVSYNLQISTQALVPPSAFTLSCNDSSPSVSNYLSCLRSSVTGAPVSSYSVSPALPAGLSLRGGVASTGNKPGEVYGIPTLATPSKTYTITASNAAGSVSANLTFGVAALQPPKPFGYSNCYPRDPTNFTYIMCSPEATATTGGSIYSAEFSISPALPAGFDFNPMSGAISGMSIVPFAPQFYTVTATNAAGSRTSTYVLALRDGSLPSTSCNASGISIGVPYWCRIPDPMGGQFYPPFMISPALPAGFSFNQFSGEISGVTSVGLPQSNYSISAYGPMGPVNIPFSISTGGGSASSMTEDLSYASEPSKFYNGDSINLHICVKGLMPNMPVSVNPPLPYYLVMSPLNNGCVTVTGQASSPSPLVNYVFTIGNMTPPNAPQILNISKAIEIVSGNPYSNYFLGYQSYPANSLPSNFTFKIGMLAKTGPAQVYTNNWPCCSPPTSPPPWIVSPSPFVDHFRILFGNLPNGMTFNSQTGEISGTPTMPNPGTNITIIGYRTPDERWSITTDPQRLSITVNPF
jgi:hypothetical protein